MRGWVEIYKQRRDRGLELLNAIPGLSCRTPGGAFYLYVNCQGLIGKRTPEGKTLETDLDVVLYLLDSVGVAVVAGSSYGVVALLPDVDRHRDRRSSRRDASVLPRPSGSCADAREMSCARRSTKAPAATSQHWWTIQQPRLSGRSHADRARKKVDGCNAAIGRRHRRAGCHGRKPRTQSRAQWLRGERIRPGSGQARELHATHPRQARAGGQVAGRAGCGLAGAAPHPADGSRGFLPSTRCWPTFGPSWSQATW